MLNQFVLAGTLVGVGGLGLNEVILEIDQEFYNVQISDHVHSKLFQTEAKEISLKGSIYLNEVGEYYLYAMEVNILSEREEVGVCVECGNALYEDDQCLPDHPNIYECSACSHPHHIERKGK